MYQFVCVIKLLAVYSSASGTSYVYYMKLVDLLCEIWVFRVSISIETCASTRPFQIFQLMRYLWYVIWKKKKNSLLLAFLKSSVKYTRYCNTYSMYMPENATQKLTHSKIGAKISFTDRQKENHAVWINRICQSAITQYYRKEWRKKKWKPNTDKKATQN